MSARCSFARACLSIYGAPLCRRVNTTTTTGTNGLGESIPSVSQLSGNLDDWGRRQLIANRMGDVVVAYNEFLKAKGEREHVEFSFNSTDWRANVKLLAFVCHQQQRRRQTSNHRRSPCDSLASPTALLTMIVVVGLE